jgi:hypothetical protein
LGENGKRRKDMGIESWKAGLFEIEQKVPSHHMLVEFLNTY